MTDTWTLIGEDGVAYASAVKGTLGGHRGLKIYGQLNCPSALNWINKGYYVQHRVFFLDEETASKAGYRPCGKCMKEEYQTWKEANPEAYQAGKRAWQVEAPEGS